MSSGVSSAKKAEADASVDEVRRVSEGGLGAGLRGDGGPFGWDAPAKLLEASGRTITFVRVLGGKVVHRIDFADYDTAVRQRESQAQAR